MSYATEQSVLNAQHNAAVLAQQAAEASAQSQRDVAYEHMRPSVLYRPGLSIDGDQWCALYGDNLQSGVAGFGSSPDAAMRAFDSAWDTPLRARAQEAGND